MLHARKSCSWRAKAIKEKPFVAFEGQKGKFTVTTSVKNYESWFDLLPKKQSANGWRLS